MTTPENPYGPPPKLDLTELVDAINSERQKHNRPDLASDVQLTDLAQSWADYMARYSVMTHGAFPTRLNHVFPNVVGAEDIGQGATSIAQVMQMWMNSPPHRANILGDFNLVGVGKGVDINGMTFWCIDFVKASR